MFTSDEKVKKQIIWFLPVVAVTLVVSVYMARLSIISDMQGIGRYYVTKIEKAILKLEANNQVALSADLSCSDVVKQLRYGNYLMRQLVVVKRGYVVCSSERGMINQDIRQYVNNGKLKPGISIAKIPNVLEKRTLYVNTIDGSNSDIGSSAILDPDYIRDLLDSADRNNVNDVVLVVGDLTIPEQVALTGNLQSVVSSSRHQFSVITEASREYFYQRSALFSLYGLLLAGVIFSAYLMMEQWFRKRFSLVDDLTRGMKAGELFLLYQPIVCASSGRVSGAEALVRWNHPKIGMINPDTFIPLAEENGLINQLTDYVLGRALADMSELALPERFHLGINVPPSFLIEDDAMKKVSSLKPRFEALGVELCFEVTERQFLDQRVASQLSSVRKLGVEVAIDDFGTGQTALSVLQTISFDYLKIDKSFVDTIGVDSVNHHVLDAIIDLAHRLEVKIVAEGVEDNTQTGYLKERGCHYLQGYNFFKPLSLDDLASSFVVKQPVELVSNESLEEVG